VNIKKRQKDMKKRNLIFAMGTFILMTALLNPLISLASDQPKFKGHEFPKLGYEYNALEPYIDAQTMEIHYSKHHRAYFDNFMKAAENTKLAETPLEEIFKSISKESATIRNNGGGIYNHNLFWEIMTPKQGEIPAGLRQAIEKDFGSLDSFKEKFAEAARTRFGSGWAWLIVDNKGNLKVTSTPNQDNPLMDVAEERGTPILGLDVWEHAYYLKYQNRRPEYITNFWNVVNWQVVNDKYQKAKR
jgi:superoxide dismutase, Fe-Mn family